MIAPSDATRECYSSDHTDTINKTQWNLFHLLMVPLLLQVLQWTTLLMLNKKMRRCTRYHPALPLLFHVQDARQSNESARRKLVGRGNSSITFPITPLLIQDLWQCRRKEYRASLCAVYAMKIQPIYQLLTVWLHYTKMGYLTVSPTCSSSTISQIPIPQTRTRRHWHRPFRILQCCWGSHPQPLVVLVLFTNS